MSEVQWRRRWKPDLKSCSWQKLEINDPDFTHLFVKVKFSDNSYEFLASNLTEFWYEKVEETMLRKRSETLNPCIEAPLTRIVDQIRAGLENPLQYTKLTVNKKTDGILLKISSKLAGLPFAWTFKANPAEYDMGRDHLIVPLMAMVGELYRQQKELFKLLVAKDKQIDDYKAQGAQVTRRHLGTAPFDEVAFQNNMFASKGFEEEVLKFGDHAFTTAAQELYKQMATKRAWLTIGAQDAGDGQEDDDKVQGAPSAESWASRLPASIGQRNVSPNKAPSPSKNSPTKTPSKSPGSSAESTPVKDTELLRRQALERKLEQEEMKMMEKAKKKKKLKL